MQNICHLKPLAREDHSHLVRLFVDPDARAFLGGPVDAAAASIKSTAWIDSSPEAPIWAIRRMADSTFLEKVQSMLIACMTLLGVSCTFNGEHRDSQPGNHHALLTADKGVSWRDRGPTVFAINSHPTSFGRVSEKFRVPPGDTVLTVIADREPYGFEPLRFKAFQGRHYHLRYGERRHSVLLYDVTNAEKEVLVSESSRDTMPPSAKSIGKSPETEHVMGGNGG